MTDTDKVRSHLLEMEASVVKIWGPLLLMYPDSEYAKISYYNTQAYCDGLRNAISMMEEETA